MHIMYKSDCGSKYLKLEKTVSVKENYSLQMYCVCVTPHSYVYSLFRRKSKYSNEGQAVAVETVYQLICSALQLPMLQKLA